MSSTPSDRRPSALARGLIEAARDEAPAEMVAQRALDLVEAAPIAPKRVARSSRWWGLAAAAAAIGVVSFGLLSAGGDDAPATSPAAAPSLVPVPEVVPPEVTAVPMATALAVGTGGAEPDREPAGGAVPDPVAQHRPTAAPKAAAPPAKPAPAKGACGCAPADLMCHMRCSEKK